jgi:hypothetical protein
MKTNDRDLLVLLKNEFMSQQAIEKEVEYLNSILLNTEQPGELCRAHELVQRNQITQKSQKILSALSQPELKTFWFLIGKN